MNTDHTSKIELQTRQPLLSKFKHGEAKHSATDLSEIAHGDNTQAMEGTSTIISSKMIVEDFKGIDSIAKSLFTDIQSGIEGSLQDIQERQAAYGKNAFAPPKIKSLFELVMENFDDPINRILLAAAFVSVVIGLIQHGYPDGMIEGTSILIALNIIIIVNSGNNWISERRLADLVNLSEKQEVAVYRNSTEATTIDSSLLVVGDIIKFEAGMKVPADCIMVDGQDVMCVEGELTGEPNDIEKVVVTESNYQSGILGTMLAKSLVTSGFGKAMVIAVGPNSFAGVITTKTQVVTGPTNLQIKLESIANKIGNVGIAVAVLTFFAMIVRVCLEMGKIIPCGCGNLFTCEVDPNCVPLSFAFTMENRLWNEVLNTVIIAITVIVVAIPEGLPLAVTISLSFSSAKMRKMNNLVRKLASSETMGGATHICSDKTGTLTLNKMTVMACMTLEKAHYMPQGIVSNKLAKNIKEITEEVMASGYSTWSLLVNGVMWNSSARIEKNDGSDNSNTDEYVTKGNVTEQGLIKFFMHALTGEGCLNEKRALLEENILTIISFTSSRKRASIVVRNPEKEGTNEEVRVFTKGAPDMLFDYTSHAISADGSIVSLGDSATVSDELLFDGEQSGHKDSQRGLFERSVKKFAYQAYRTLLITYKDMSMYDYNLLKSSHNDFEKEKDRECLEQDLTAIGIFGLQDPLRPTIIDSIIKCKTAGIQVIMCTGDNIDTATAISKNAGIVTDEQCKHHYTCMTGKDFREATGGLIEVADPSGKLEEVKDPENPDKMIKVPAKIDVVKDMFKFRKIQQHLRVLARSSPEDKLLLVTGIQASNGVVAVTGDGTNDAPALTKADVGFSMGITGTDVAKGASDIILLDDNFSSIIVALRFGRNVYDNVRKFIQFQLTVNVVAMFIVFFGSVILKDSPLNAVQMLWVNLIMDTFAALALATEPPAFDILERMPYSKDAAIVTEIMWRNVFGHAIYQIIVLIVVIFAAQGNFVKNYSASCIKFVDNSTSCLEWNPYYATTLYEDEATQEWWQTQNLSSSDFDQDLLKEYSCDIYYEAHRDTYPNRTTFDCDTIWADSANTVLPGDVDLTDTFATQTQKLLHFTYVFQIFVFMQLFNQINARKIEDGEMNVFKGFFNNFLFLTVTIFTFAVQMFMVEVGGKAVKCFPLTKDQNMFCLLFGAGELIWGLLIKYTPLKWYQCISLDESPLEEGATTLTSALKRSSVMRRPDPKAENMKKQLNEELKKRFTAQLRQQQTGDFSAAIN